MVERLAHGFLGDLVEHDAPDGNLGLEDLRQMPADRLPFAIRVGGQQQFGGFLERHLQVGHLLLLVAGNDVVRLEVLIDVDAEPSPVLLFDFLRDLSGRLGQITDVPKARFHPVLGAEEAAERLRLRWRFDYDERFSH